MPYMLRGCQTMHVREILLNLVFPTPRYGGLNQCLFNIWYCTELSHQAEWFCQLE